MPGKRGALTIILINAGRWVTRTPGRGHEVQAPLPKGCVDQSSPRPQVLQALLGGSCPSRGMKVFWGPVPLCLWLSPHIAGSGSYTETQF